MQRIHCQRPLYYYVHMSLTVKVVNCLAIHPQSVFNLSDHFAKSFELPCKISSSAHPNHIMFIVFVKLTMKALLYSC